MRSLRFLVETAPERRGDLHVAEAPADRPAESAPRLDAGARDAAHRQPSRSARPWLGLAATVGVLSLGYVVYARWTGDQAAPAASPAAPKVVVSRPVQRMLDEQLGFLGQFSAVDQVELRAQVGGILTDIRFKDGAVVQKGDLLFIIDPAPYEIRLAQVSAQLESAKARLELADRDLARARELKRTDAGTERNVDQRSADQRAAQAAVDDTQAQIRDARFDLDHCRILAPFTGRIGTHLVSVGNLVAGSRAATSPTTLLATIVSLDPIYLNFDMSESDYLAFSRSNAGRKGPLADEVRIALSDETTFGRKGKLDFVDNALDRSSGTLHARATVPNPDLLLTAGEFARVRLMLGSPTPMLLVPDAAVSPDQSQHVVMTVGADGTVTPKQVRVGDIRDGLRVVRSGLAPTDRVIVEGIPYAAPGAKVEAHDGLIKAADTASN